MTKYSLLEVLLSSLFLGSPVAIAAKTELNHTPEMKGVTWAKGTNEAKAQNAPLRAKALLAYHGGRILPHVVTKSIFWGPSWGNSLFVADKIAGLDAWYTGHNGSNYAKTVDEYYDTVSGGHQIGATGFQHQGHVVDVSTASGGNNTSAILAEVCKQISAGNIALDPSGNGFYAVYTDLPRGNSNYCAYHSSGTCAGSSVPVQFGFFWSLDSDPGCNPGDTQTGHTQGLAALANVTAHEVSEARSDPDSPAAWYDGQGYENGDKCAWTFNVPYVTFTDGNIWKLQGEWSNAAYSNNSGYANSSGQKGCLDGH
jgi:hypothetical protein